jgi:uncharacterized membrane protein
MKLFPTKEKEFKLIDSQSVTLDRLLRRTERSERLTSQHTDKSFRGMITGNEFKLISSSIGKGAFCVMTGEIQSNSGKVTVEIHKVFRILLSIFLCVPIFATIALIGTQTEEFSFFLLFIMIGQMLMIRFAFIGLAFYFLSKSSLNRLGDVIDLEWVKSI